MEKGLVHIYTGEGKGKTTAALGLGMRACGNGLRVLMVQFLKTTKSGEQESCKGFSGTFQIVRFQKQTGFFPDMTSEQKLKSIAETMAGVEFAKGCLMMGEYDLVILDEILATIALGIVPLELVVELAKNKHAGTELVMTGRDAPGELIELANYVTEMMPIKHPYNEGTPARKGIEY